MANGSTPWRSGGMASSRITLDRGVMAGLPTIRGVRIKLMVADDMSSADIRRELPDLEAEDLAEALRYAAAAVGDRDLALP